MNDKHTLVNRLYFYSTGDKSLATRLCAEAAGRIEELETQVMEMKNHEARIALLEKEVARLKWLMP